MWPRRVVRARRNASWTHLGVCGRCELESRSGRQDATTPSAAGHSTEASAMPSSTYMAEKDDSSSSRADEAEGRDDEDICEGRRGGKWRMGR